MQSVEFEEKQTAKGMILIVQSILILITTTILTVVVIIPYLSRGRLNSSALGVAGLALGAGVLVWLLFRYMTLRTIITSDYIAVQYKPFQFSPVKIKCSDIESYEVRTYEPLMEYGGWGLRYSLINGKAYNISGNIGLQLYLQNGKKILIGTEQPEAIERVMQKVLGF
ncbi:MAG: hypothetical protein EAZ57_06750 [Cytophagales bacterium]|nr:MAG: hypothetical protein EAZ67_07785 [Cytophagales bacterium]TAF60558.1 MAG: hypothetical protein EAZ57_06750 [Cytophagales bacterium]